MKHVIPVMRDAGGGSIINTSSTVGLIARIGSAAYHASKGGVTVLTKNAAVTYGRFGIRVNSIHPGGILTAQLAGAGASVAEDILAKTPLGRLGTADEIADLVVFLGSDNSAFITGASITIDGGYTAQ